MKTLKETILISLILAIIFANRVFAQEKTWNSVQDIRKVTELATAEKWELIKQDKGVTLSSRWLTFGDTLKSREISSAFVVNTDAQTFLRNLKQRERIIAWNDGVRNMTLLKNEGTTWVTHIVYDIPYPFSQQDLVVQNVMIKENQKIIILLSALPDYISPLNNVTRQRLYFGKWELTPLTDGRTEVLFSAISFSKSSIPRFIRDPIIQSKLFNSFVMLKDLASSGEVAFKN